MELAVDICVLSYNATKSAATGYSPYYMTHGAPCMYPFDTNLTIKRGVLFRILRSTCKKVYILTKQNSEVNKDYGSTYHDKNRKTPTYKIGDQCCYLVHLEKHENLKNFASLLS